jgi:alanine-glyoxylate transaminase/serine-glyoxylate transaminase/serine-pyruvate transaminase
MSDQNPIFIPGPTNTPDRLRRAMQVQNLDHRSRAFAETFMPVLQDLKPVFGTVDATTLIYPSTGTGGWEVAIANTLSPGDRVLAARYGLFSDRWIDTCKRFGLRVDVIDCVWGDGVPIAEIEAALTRDKAHEIKAVLVTHNETATGVRADVAGVRAAMDAASHPAMLYVDAVSSLASMDFRMDEWGIDVAVAGSQKGFMLNAGKAVLAVSPKALEAHRSATLPHAFNDFTDMITANQSGGYPYTPPLQLIFGLRASLDMLAEEGLEAVYARHFKMAEGVRRAITALGLNLVANASHLYSDTVSSIYVPEGCDGNRLVAHASEVYGMSFGVGLGKLNGKTFRIGHLGSLTVPMMLSGLATIEMALVDMGVGLQLGTGVAAAQDYYRSNQAGATKYLAA